VLARRPEPVLERDARPLVGCQFAGLDGDDPTVDPERRV